MNRDFTSLRLRCTDRRETWSPLMGKNVFVVSFQMEQKDQVDAANLVLTGDESQLGDFEVGKVYQHTLSST